MENVDWRHLTTGSSGLTGQARSQLNRMIDWSIASEEETFDLEYLDKMGTAHTEDRIFRIYAFDVHELVLLSNQIDRLVHGKELVVLDGIVDFMLSQSGGW